MIRVMVVVDTPPGATECLLNTDDIVLISSAAGAPDSPLVAVLRTGLTARLHPDHTLDALQDAIEADQRKRQVTYSPAELVVREMSS